LSGAGGLHLDLGLVAAPEEILHASGGHSIIGIVIFHEHAVIVDTIAGVFIVVLRNVDLLTDHLLESFHSLGTNVLAQGGHLVHQIIGEFDRLASVRGLGKSGFILIQKLVDHGGVHGYVGKLHLKLRHVGAQLIDDSRCVAVAGGARGPDGTAGHVARQGGGNLGCQAFGKILLAKSAKGLSSSSPNRLQDANAKELAKQRQAIRPNIVRFFIFSSLRIYRCRNKKLSITTNISGPENGYPDCFYIPRAFFSH
jgi:hypothetical protein